MAKQVKLNTETALSTQISKDQYAQVLAQTSPDDMNGMAELFKVAKQVNVKELQKVAGDDYLELEEGETYLLVCKGIIENALPSKSDPTKYVDAVSLLREDMTETINADAVMVSSIKKQDQKRFPCMMQVYVKGVKKSAKGEYKDLDIYLY